MLIYRFSVQESGLKIRQQLTNTDSLLVKRIIDWSHHLNITDFSIPVHHELNVYNPLDSPSCCLIWISDIASEEIHQRLFATRELRSLLRLFI